MVSIRQEEIVKTPAKPVLRLCKTQRLRTPGQFRSVYQNKQWGGSLHHTFNIKASNLKGSSRASMLGVTVSRKVSNSAVIRNRIKRQIREFYRHRQFELSDAEVVITAKPSCAIASDSDRRESLEVLWQKLIKWQQWHQKANTKESGMGE